MNPLKKAKRNMKRSLANKTGIPTTKSGRQRKIDSLVSQGAVILIIIIVIVYFIGGGGA